jgi:uncharacterized membrane protein YcaP (DUF421 family)
MSLNELTMYGTKLIIGLITLILLLRLMGNKELAQISAIDLAAVVILGDLVSGAIETPELNWLHLIYLSSIWAILLFTVEFIEKIG